MPDQLSPFLGSYIKTLNKSGAIERLDAAGAVFFCKEASATFLMRLDGGRWFDMDQSFDFIWPDGFTTIDLKAKDGATADVNVSFYVGSREIRAHLNIVRDPNNFQSFTYFQAKTIPKGYTEDTIAGGAVLTFFGIGGTGPTQAGAAYSYRKAIIITNDDPASVLEIFDTSTPTPRRLGTVQPLKAWLMETSADIAIKNETGTAIPLRVCELFYPAPS